MLAIIYKTVKDTQVNKLDEIKPGSWIYLESPTQEELGKAAGISGTDPSLLKDALDPYEVPRLEVEGENGEDLYIYTRVPISENNQVNTIPFLLVLNSKYLITVCSQKLPFLEKFMSGGVAINTTQKIKFFILVFTEINSLYSRHLNDLNKNVRNLGFTLEKIHNKDIIRLVSFENILYDFLSALVPTNAMLMNLLNGKMLKLYKDDHDLVEDLSLANNQILQLSKSTLSTIRNIREAYSTIMTNNLNRVIKFFTVLTIIVSIPNIIGSFFGMNVPVPLADHPFAFGVIVGFSILVALILLWIFRKEDWL